MRLSPITMAVAAGAIGTIALLLGLVINFGREQQPPAAADTVDAAAFTRAPPPSAPTAARRRTRQVPRFEVVAPPTQAAPPPPVQGESQEMRELKERASKDGFLYREAGSQEIYVVQHGTRWPIKSAEELQALGMDPNSVQEVPPNSLRFLKNQPPDRTLWRERDKAEVYYYENGQKRWVTEEAFKRAGYDFKDVKVLPAGGLKDHTTGAPILR